MSALARVVSGLLLVLAQCAAAQDAATLFRPDAVFDGEAMHDGWVVVVDGARIVYAGEADGVDGYTVGDTVNLPGMTLLPGLIEGHSHILLHPYNETSWDDQVLREPVAERAARAVNHARASLLAGITTMRDLGSEGAGYADVAIRDSIAKGIFPGPRLLVAGRAIVATGSYGPKGFHEGVHVPLGAEEADGFDDLVRVVRSQIGHGIDLVKVYADYRWGPDGTAAPTFTEAEFETIVQVAESSGRYVAAHATTAEGMRRAVVGGVRTVEHGDEGDEAVWRLMRRNGVALCPTLAVGEAIAEYGGWQKGVDPDTPRIAAKKRSFREALEAGVTICFGGDVGPFPHGDNVWELELMVEYGMGAIDALRSATSVNAEIFGLADEVGRVRSGMVADLIAVPGNPADDIGTLRNVELVVSGGHIVKPAGNAQ